METTTRLPLRNSSYLGHVIVIVTVLLPLCVFVLWQTKLVGAASQRLEENVPSTSRLPLLRSSVIALEKALDHLFVVGEGINLDAVFGMRLVADQLQALRDHVIAPFESRAEHHGLSYLFEQLNRTQEKARQFSQRFTKTVEKNQPDYYKSMSFLLTAGSWELWYPQRDISRNDTPSYGFEKTIQETLSLAALDECIREPYGKQCQFTKKCWVQMTNFTRSGYSLTHEAIFILTSFAVGCEKEVEISAQNWTNMSSDEILDRLITVVHYEAELIANRSFPLYHRDLFMEQVAVGGILGYRDLIRDEWIEQILSWQDESGCFLLDNNTAIKMLDKDFPNHPKVSLPEKLRSLEFSDGKYSEVSPATPSLQRHKRNEVLLPDGCWAHMTGVGIMALGQIIRHLLEPLLKHFE